MRLAALMLILIAAAAGCVGQVPAAPQITIEEFYIEPANIVDGSIARLYIKVKSMDDSVNESLVRIIFDESDRKFVRAEPQEIRIGALRSGEEIKKFSIINATIAAGERAEYKVTAELVVNGTKVESRETRISVAKKQQQQNQSR